MIYFENVSKIYNAISVALENITFSVEPKEFVSLVGRSGTGKTTIVKILTAEEPPSKGQIIVGGWDITKIKSKKEFLDHYSKQSKAEYY